MNNKKRLICALFLLAAFVLFTVLVCCVDVRAVGANNTSVGFARLNLHIHRLTGVHLVLYRLTDWLSLVPLGVVLGFALTGSLQLLRRKSLLKVDRSLIVLGGFYAAVAAAYMLFESFVINYRPILIDGVLEGSYPSSTTLLVLCVIPASLMYLRGRINNSRLKCVVTLSAGCFTVFMVIARLVSGVHWFTDIIGGVLLSGGLIMLYRYFLKRSSA